MIGSTFGTVCHWVPLVTSPVFPCATPPLVFICSICFKTSAFGVSELFGGCMTSIFDHSQSLKQAKILYLDLNTNADTPFLSHVFEEITA